MNLEKQVNSKELGEKLKELGVKQESFFVWFHMNTGWEIVGKFPSISDLYYPAYTVAELGEMLPENVNTATNVKDSRLNGGCIVVYKEHRTFATTEANARAEMLCFLIENDLIKI